MNKWTFGLDFLNESIKFRGVWFETINKGRKKFNVLRDRFLINDAPVEEKGFLVAWSSFHQRTKLTLLL